jgi:hypothetical protein
LSTKQIINDPLFVKRLERRLGRKLSEDELVQDELELRFPNGQRDWIIIPKIVFPTDLLTRPDTNWDLSWVDFMSDDNSAA